MLRPPNLNSGDEVRIISTARKIEKPIVESAAKLLTSWGLEVSLGNHLFDEDHQYAGRDADRISDLQNALDDANCKAIFCARGGYGTLRLIDHLNFNAFLNLPKWIIGYSDATVLHCHLQQMIGVESLHATMPVNFTDNTPTSLELTRKTLFGEALRYDFPTQSLNRNGRARGTLVGGNLSILYSLQGSGSFPSTEGKILFMEDLDEYLYHLDRMILSLKRAAVFEGLQGLVVGGMTDMNDNDIPFGKTAIEIISEHVEEYSFPVCFGLPAGHIENNCPLLLGRNVELAVSRTGSSLTFSS